MKTLLCWLGVLWAWIGGELYAGGPSVLYLTWMHDPSTTMTIHWHSSQNKTHSSVLYQKEGETTWERSEGLYTPLEGSHVGLHVVELSELQPDSVYRFRLEEGGDKEYTFRTLPQTLSRPVKFVVGGDAYFYLGRFRKMNAQVAAQDPDFVVIGGDIAYTINSRALFKGKEWELRRWRRFFKEWKTQMVTSEGRLIPLVVALGNHDIKLSTLSPSTKHFLFYDLFAFPERDVSYRTLDAGNYLSLFLLDTGHSYHIEGLQTQWLDRRLFERQGMLYKMAAYHVGAYPSVCPSQGVVPRKLRSLWCPLFERYQLQVAFEHHNHAYKRTFPMKRGQIDPDGVVYMGDGSWGISPRKPKDFWYLNKRAQVNAVCVVTLTPEKGRVEALNIQGRIFDAVEVQPTHGVVAWDESRSWLQYH